MPQSLPPVEKRKTLLYGLVALVVCLLIGIGVLAKQGWLPHTDSFSGKRKTWFGKELPKNASSSWNPLAPPLPSPTPQLAKELIYAGQKLVAIEDANANAAPPADLAIWRPSNGEWWTLNSQGGTSTYSFGVSSDRPVPGDFDGDGKTDFAVFRPSTGEWWETYSSTGGYTAVQFGVGTDDPAQADFDGDGKTDSAVFRKNDPSSGLATFYIRKSSDGSFYAVQFGVSTDVPAAADYDGDGRADVGVWRGSNQTFYSINSGNGQPQTIALGQSGDKAVSADYDGDGKADYAVYASSTADWHIRLSTTGSLMPNARWGSAQSSGCTGGSCAGEVPVQNDYDGDGKVDIATWRDSNGNWTIKKSTGGTREEHWGQSDDIPVPAFYRR